MEFIPLKKGSWVQFNLEQEAAKQADAAGAWRTRSNKFCGIFIGESRTVEGVLTHPPRVMLVDEKGNNVRGIFNWTVHDVWASLSPQPPEVLALMAGLGCMGSVADVEPVDDREDIPPGRRPDVHPRDLRRPFSSLVPTSASTPAKG